MRKAQSLHLPFIYPRAIDFKEGKRAEQEKKEEINNQQQTYRGLEEEAQPINNPQISLSYNEWLCNAPRSDNRCKTTF